MRVGAAERTETFAICDQYTLQGDAFSRAIREGSALSVEVTKAEGEKCERCWNYSTHVGEDATYPTVCERCSANLRTIVGEGAAHE